MTHWINTIVPYNRNSKLSEKNFCDSHGQKVLGVCEITFKSLALEFLEDLNDKQCILCCNFLAAFEIDAKGTLKRTFSPIQMLQLSGRRGKFQVINLSQQPYHQFSDNSNIKIWLQDLDSNKIDISMSVHCAYRKKN